MMLIRGRDLCGVASYAQIRSADNAINVVVCDIGGFDEQRKRTVYLETLDTA